MADEDLDAYQAAERILSALDAGKLYETKISKQTYDALFSRLSTEIPNLCPSVFLLRGRATVQFSGYSPATFVVIGNGELTKDSFTNCIVMQATRPLRHWLIALGQEVALLRWTLVPLFLLGSFLLAIQTPGDLHGYFTLMAQVLAVVFTLYAVLRLTFRPQDETEWQGASDDALDKMYQAERIVGVTAIGSILLCLLEFVLTSDSTSRWDYAHTLVLGSLSLAPIHGLTVLIGVSQSILLASFLRTLVFYYPDRDFGRALLRFRDSWFKKQHLRAREELHLDANSLQ